MWQTKKIPIQYLESLCNHQGYISQCSLEDRPCWITHSPLSCLSHSSPAARWICAVVIFFWKCHFIGGRGGHRHRSILQLIPPVHTSVYLSSVSLWLNEHLILMLTVSSADIRNVLPKTKSFLAHFCYRNECMGHTAWAPEVKTLDKRPKTQRVTTLQVEVGPKISSWFL